MKKRILLAAGLLLLLCLGGYLTFDRLGGNRPILISIVDKSPDTLTGETFKGTPIDNKLEALFRSVETLQSLHPGTSLHTIYEIEPAGKLDTLEVFAGINLPFGAPGFAQKKFTEKRYLLAKVSGSRWVMPSPEKIKARLQDYAASKNLVLSGYYIDKIISESEVHVIAPIR
jgi:hypothetical protein